MKINLGVYLFKIAILILACTVLVSLTRQKSSLLAISYDGESSTRRTMEVERNDTSRYRNVTLIVQLRGELGNHLAILAGAHITQLIAAQLYPNIRLQLIGQHQTSTERGRHQLKKWIRARNDLIRCFPEFKNFVFDGGIHDPEFLEIQAIQKTWLSESEEQKLTNAREEGLEFTQSLMEKQERGIPGVPQQPGNITKYSIPFMVANSFSWSDGLRNKTWYDNIRNWMRFNESACCSKLPDSRDVVYHHRNFMTEMKHRAYGNHYTEATPKTVSNVIFGNSPLATDIAITSRYKHGIEPYIDALEAKGIRTRFIANQTGVQDFCFLMKAQNELVGKYQSTFVRWAAFLGNATTNRFYALDQSKNQTQPKSIRTLEVIQQGSRRFVSEEYWQPSEKI
jgi:hypothetical protein